MAQDIGFYSDASAAKNLGFGAIFKTRWIKGLWTERFTEQCKPSIEYLELFALCARILTWKDQSELNNNRILVQCDNVVVVGMINKMTSGCKNCMWLLRILVLHCLKNHLKVMAAYINTKKNCLSDELSHNQMTRFFKLGPHMRQTPDPITEEVWPVWNVWQQ